MKTNKARELLTHLLTESKLYHQGKQYKELLDFINRMPNIAPFNAMLLQVQKPGLRFAASASDWEQRFGRQIIEGARPLVILWPFAPVVFIYDMEDTCGDLLPADVAAAFRATGDMNKSVISHCIRRLENNGINVQCVTYGDAHAGHIARAEHEHDLDIRQRSQHKKQKPDYQIRINARHNPNVQFATLMHELAHLFLGHLGPDSYLKIKRRSHVPNRDVREIEAESVCYLVCKRHRVTPDSESYLNAYVDQALQAEDLDLHNLLTAAGRIEAILDLTKHTGF